MKLFEFDPQKSVINKSKHGIAFIEAQALWNQRTLVGPAKFRGEMRYMITGKIDEKYWTAVVTYRGAVIRIISVRQAVALRSKSMNDDPISESEQRGKLPPITAEEFDAKFDAGEDVSAYVDWDSAVMVEPGEMSPGQKLSMIEAAIGELLAQQNGLGSSLLERVDMSISIPRILLSKIGSEAVRQNVSRDELVQAWIEAKFEEQHAVK